MKYGSLVSQNIPSIGQLDIQVQALIGSPIVHHTSDHLDLYNTWASFSFNGTSSNWSETQTISIPDGKVTISASAEASPTVPELSWLAIVPLLIATLLIAIKFRIRKTPRPSEDFHKRAVFS